MTKRKIILPTLALLLITAIGFNMKKVTAAISSPDYNIQFNNSFTTDELKNFVNKYQLNIKELYFSQGEGAGGYTVLDDKNIDEIIIDLNFKHQQSLSEAIEENKKFIKNSKDAEEIQRIQTLQNTFLKESNQDTKSQLLIASIDISVSDKKITALLKNNPLVKEISKKSTKILSRLESNNQDLQNNEQGAINSLYHETWAPYGGNSTVNRSSSYQTFNFNNVSAFTSNTTYEHETQIYNRSFANYGGYWYSNLPTPYLDTNFLDTCGTYSCDNFTIGTPRANWITRNTQYYANMLLTPQSATSALVRIKGQKGHRTPSNCYTTWCVFADATTGSMATYTAPSGMSWQY